MYEAIERREFLRSAAMAALALPILSACGDGIVAQSGESEVLRGLRKNAQAQGAEAMGAIDVPGTVSWKTDFGVKKDDGDPLIVSGTIYKKDGKTVAPNTLVYFYHTDKFGIYGRDGQHKHGRYRGWMLTDDKGRYEFSSIRPASYPNSTQSQHVHMTITTLDTREDWIDSILFEGDPLVTSREREWSGRRGGFNPIIKLTKGSDGIYRGVRDIQLTA